MKKRLFVTLLSLMMVTTMLAGCNKNEPETTDDTTVSIEETEELEETLDEFEEKLETTEKDDESTVTDEDTKNDKDNSKAESKDSEVLDRSYTVDDVVNSIDPDNFGFRISAEGLTVEMAKSAENMKMVYEVEFSADQMKSMVESGNIVGEYDVENPYTFTCELYSVDDTTYCYSNMNGTDEYFKIAATDETTESEDLFNDFPETEEMGMTNETIASVEYTETIKYNGNSVDVVKVTGVEDPELGTAEEFYMYINPETGMAVAMMVPEEGESGNDMVMDILSDPIALPAEFDGCVEADAAKVEEYLFAVIMLPMMLE